MTEQQNYIIYETQKNITPTTIEELKTWYRTNNLPDEDTARIYIDQDVRYARSSGICNNGTRFIVYQNLPDGSREIFYKGPIELLAVNTFMEKVVKKNFPKIFGTTTAISSEQSQRTNTSGLPGKQQLFLIHFFGIFVAMLVAMSAVPRLLPAAMWLFLSINPGIFIMLPILKLIKDKQTADTVADIWHISSFIIFAIIAILFICFDASSLLGIKVDF